MTPRRRCSPNGPDGEPSPVGRRLRPRHDRPAVPAARPAPTRDRTRGQPPASAHPRRTAHAPRAPAATVGRRTVRPSQPPTDAAGNRCSGASTSCSRGPGRPGSAVGIRRRLHGRGRVSRPRGRRLHTLPASGATRQQPPRSCRRLAGLPILMLETVREFAAEQLEGAAVPRGATPPCRVPPDLRRIARPVDRRSCGRRAEKIRPRSGRAVQPPGGARLGAGRGSGLGLELMAALEQFWIPRIRRRAPAGSRRFSTERRPRRRMSGRGRYEIWAGQSSSSVINPKRCVVTTPVSSSTANSQTRATSCNSSPFPCNKRCTPATCPGRARSSRRDFRVRPPVGTGSRGAGTAADLRLARTRGGRS